MKYPAQDQNIQDSVTLAATTTSASVEIRGSVVSRVTDTLLDLISPFTNSIGWVGDQLSYARREAAIRAASRAQEQLKREGITSGKVPPKILLPWLEGASQETDQSDNLTDAWAGLFVRSVKSPDTVVISYIETLRKLGRKEAELLKFFATDTAPSYSLKFYHRDADGIFLDSNPLLPRLINRLEKTLHSKNAKDIEETFDKIGFQGMCQIIFYTSDLTGTQATPFFKENEHEISNLEHLGLISIRSRALPTSHGAVEIVWFEITKYAFDMVWACLRTLTGDTKTSRPKTKATGNKA